MDWNHSARQKCLEYIEKLKDFNTAIKTIQELNCFHVAFMVNMIVDRLAGKFHGTGTPMLNLPVMQVPASFNLTINDDWK